VAHRIKNWEKFQHYKNRRPPWIRIYRDLLNDPNFEELPGELVKTLVKLWLAASEFSTDGTLPDLNRLALTTHIASKLLAEQLRQLNHWVEYDASDVLAPCKQLATPETETEGESYLTVDASAPVAHRENPGSGDLGSSPSKLLSLTPGTTGGSNRKKAITKARYAKGTPTWDAYSGAYRARYGTAPPRNAKTNSLCVQLVEALGADDAPAVAHYYLSTNAQPYAGGGHPLELLKRDAQKMHTEWKTGNRMTQSQARERDRIQGTGDVWTKIIAENEGEDR